MKAINIIIGVMLGILLILFFKSDSILQILTGFIILLLLLIKNTNDRKLKYSRIEMASHETFYDAMKWIAFSIFIVIYPPLVKTNTLVFLISILFFVLVLFFLNFLKEKNSPR